MKSKSSPSAPLNLCPPTGVTGTVLPASPEGVACVPALIKGEHYDVSSLSFVGWTDGDGTGHEGYNVADYFRGGIYLGPDDHGIEPIANLPSPAEPVKVPASPVKDTPADPLEGLNEDEIGLRHAQSWSKAGIPDLGAHLDAPASPVDSVGVSDKYTWTKLEVAASEFDHAQAVICDADGFKVATCSLNFAREAVQVYRSHAAKDAKIKALEEALDGLLDAIHYDAVSFPSSPKAVSTARAALTLPCA